jgi:hypothetical protein
MPDKAERAPEPPKKAQQDAAEAFMAATSQSQDYAPAPQGMLSNVRLGLPDRDVYFRVKPIEEVPLPNGKKKYLNVAIAWLYSVPRGSKLTMNEPNQWVVDATLVPAFMDKKARLEQCHIRQAVDRQGRSYMIPIPIAPGWSADGTRTVVREAETKWVKQWWDPRKGREWLAGDEQSLTPDYPPESFEVMYMLSVKPIFIDTKEHEIYKRVCGAT